MKNKYLGQVIDNNCHVPEASRSFAIKIIPRLQNITTLKAFCIAHSINKHIHQICMC